nr:MAG TPA: hypothetical protein [Caudoviricetes sp.]
MLMEFIFGKTEETKEHQLSVWEAIGEALYGLYAVVVSIFMQIGETIRGAISVLYDFIDGKTETLSNNLREFFV